MALKKTFSLLGVCCAVASGSGALAEDPCQTQLSDVAAKLACLEKEHPRLFLGAQGFDILKRNSQTSVGKAIAGRVINDASLLLAQPPLERVFDASSRRILTVSREAQFRINNLAVAYELTEDARYASRAIKELLALSEFPDWNPKHFLDTAEMTLAVSLGYDWLYERMTPEQRKTVLTAIVEKGLKPSMEVKGGWVDGPANWTAVCHAGSIAGALAVHESEPKLAAAIIQRAIVNFPKYLKEAYGSNGAYPEGVGYWGYGTEFTVIALALLNAAFESDFGLSSCAEGFKRTGDFVAHANGPSGLSFSYADVGSNTHPQKGRLYFSSSIANTWLSVRYQRPEWYSCSERDAELRIAAGKKDVLPRDVQGIRFFPLNLLFMPERMPPETLENPRKDLSYFSGNDGFTSVSMHRSDWSSQAIYIGIKGGSPSGPHCHMDAGSFVLDADGVRWAEDLGLVDYSRFEKLGIKIWDASQNGQRWEVFRYGQKSHNILTIDGQQQKAEAMARTVKFNGEPGSQSSVIDLSTIYEGQAKSVTRSVQLLPSKQLVISDRLTGLKPGAVVRWQICTRAKVEILPGGKVRLERDGEALELEAFKPASGAWKAVESSKLMKDYDSLPWCTDDKETTMLQLVSAAPANGALDIQISILPGSVDPKERKPAAEIPAIP